MVLADLGRKINSAFTELTKAPVIDEKVNKKSKNDDEQKKTKLQLFFTFHL
jgi:hypothetical protein